MSDQEREPKDNDPKAPAPDPRERSRPTSRKYPVRFEFVIPNRGGWENRQTRPNDPEE